MSTNKRSLQILRNAGLILVFLQVILIPDIKPTIAQPNTTFLVTTNSDAPDDLVGDGLCRVGEVAGQCSLRAAIMEAHVNGNDTINFDADYIININTPLTLDADNVTITGGDYDIWIVDNMGSSSTDSMLYIKGNSDVISYLTIYGSPQNGIQISGLPGQGNNNTLEHLVLVNNAFAGIAIIGDLGHTSGSGNTIRHNEIGVQDRSVNPCAGWGNGYGINISTYSYNTTIDDNFIDCNTIDGVSIGQSTTGSITGNTLSGNHYDGIRFNGSDNFNLSGNYIGNLYGTTSMANGRDGVRLEYSANNITIGGSLFEDMNVISGNKESGITLWYSSHDITIDRNYIGLDSTDQPMGNAEAGIAIRNSTGITIGNAYDSKSQYIVNNDREGVYIADSSGITIGYSNFIGVGPSGEYMGNQREGIYVDGGTTNTTIYAHSILYNWLAGIALADFTTTYGITTLPTEICQNNGLPVDLKNDGTTLNDPGDVDTGPNGVLNYPVITDILSGHISGTTCANCWVYFYAASMTKWKETNDGGIWLVPPGSVQANSSGNWSIAYPVSGHAAWNLRLITCQDGYHGSCSEFAPRYNTYVPLINK